ncbi:MAG: TetR/AcrR family transcriptional regulator [Novosphingobium sp.]|uniref:TetR/AcrR family transcriptional regulator n=1 Tax=Novosphingobium sp. TaxID=1874826 RepID=UPI002734DA75|nr:TetR/AcrR family transcriptional regulator [Novosphingobium sp.]MDP3548810.1 TetR/AcrR family transcriptional regulator [Novosphingobium sp.]
MSHDQPEPRPRSPRDPQATIRKILEAAREEFGANGFDGTKVEHIARRAKVSKQIVYFYFKGKDELYWELLKDISIKTNERLLKIPLDNLAPDDAIRTYVEEVYDIYAEDPVLGMVSLDQSMHGGAQLRSIHEIRQLQKTLADRLAEVVRRGQADGVFHADIDSNRIEFMTVIITVGCLSSTQMLERYSGRKWQRNADETRTFALDFIMRALRK